MRVLADFLEAQRDRLLELLAQRVQATLASAELTRSELIDHFPTILGDVVQALLDGNSPTVQLLSTHRAADAHGAQRLRIGFDLNAVVREYGLLRDCIFELLEGAGVVPSLPELRILSDCISAATADSVIRYVREREDGATAQRQLAEVAQRAEEERYRTLFESIDDGFCLVEIILDELGEAVDYRFITTNAAFAVQTGIVGAVGKTALELVPGIARSWFHRYGVVAATGQAMRFEDHEPALGRWFDVYASRVGAPALRQVAIVFKDISERKRIEKERARLFRLESAARHAAEEASRLRDEFLTTVSHELRTPLTAILGWARMLRVGSIAAEKRDQALETIERNARAQAQLIDDLLDVSGILAGKLRLEIIAVDVHAIVAAALETVRPAAEAKGIHLQATLAADGTVMADPHRLQQVAWNLLANAVKFTPGGGSVQVQVERQASSVAITVADTGVGIPRDFQPHVFERFRQADGAPTRAHGGLGLGLAIVRQLVESHGGTVSVFSEGEGRGASFTVRLPLAVVRRPEPVSPPGLEQALRSQGISCPPELDGLHVLVVDDEVHTRELLRTLLEPHGVHVRLAGSAAEGLHLLAARPPDLLLSDIDMPAEDGYALIANVRQLPADAGGEVPAVALTTYARMEDRTRALLAGYNNHLAKPVEALELLAVVTSLARRSWKRGG